MTIKDALDRAKLLMQARLREQRLEQAAQREALAASAPRAEPHPFVAEAPRPAPVHMAPLAMVDVSAAACEENRILLTEAQRRALPQADAAYRLLRSRVQQRLKRNNWSVLAIVSPGPNAGKTVTALNLALYIVREQQRPVYVLDLDMRNPSVCKYLGLTAVRPLPEYLAGDAAPEDVLFQTSVPGLIVAAARATVEGASEILAGPRLEGLLAHIRMRSPDALVIIDLPPVNVTDEALVVAPRVDALLVVTREGQTPRRDLERTLSTLSEYTVVGVIVNHSSDHQVMQYDTYGYAA